MPIASPRSSLRRGLRPTLAAITTDQQGDAERQRVHPAHPSEQRVELRQQRPDHQQAVVEARSSRNTYQTAITAVPMNQRNTRAAGAV